MHVSFVTCSYDTAFAAVNEQLNCKLNEIRGVLTDFSLIVVNDAPDRAAFAREIELVDAPEVQLVELKEPSKGTWGAKGGALRQGLTLALESTTDYLVYINLNLKVHAGQFKAGIETMEAQGYDVVAGSRDPNDGGAREGAGYIGKLKSAAFARFARTMLPPLRRFHDPNGPMKIFSPAAACTIVNSAQSDGAFFDCEWLMILEDGGFKTGVFPVVWQQQTGSRPPWRLVGHSMAGVILTRHRWKQGLYRIVPPG